MHQYDKPRVLVIDDNGPFRRLLTVSLDHECEIVGSFGDGSHASAAVAQLRPDVVLMDYHMPLMDGLTATRLLKQEQNPPRVIILTSDPDIEHEAYAAGADAYLPKDCPTNLLAQTICRIVYSVA